MECWGLATGVATWRRGGMELWSRVVSVWRGGMEVWRSERVLRSDVEKTVQEGVEWKPRSNLRNALENPERARVNVAQHKWCLVGYN